MGIKIGIFFILMLILVYATSCRAISTKTHTVETPKIPAESSIKIVLIADLHSTIYKKDQTILIEKIKQEKPDLILLSGDIVDDIVPITGTQLLLAGISGIAPIYYVTGNHEYRSGNIQGIKKELESYGVIILSDEYVRIEVNNIEIILAGIEDPDKIIHDDPNYNQDTVMKVQFRELDELSVYKILLAHRPERIMFYKTFSFDLVLSGHTHGGQVRIPPINGLYAPHQGLFPKYGGGLYKHGNLTHIISRGLSVNMIPRIFNPPELVVVVIQSN